MSKTPFDFLVKPRLPSGADVDLILTTLRHEAERQQVQWVAKRVSHLPSAISMTAKLETTGKGDLVQRCTAAEAAMELILKHQEAALVLLKVFNLLEQLNNNTPLVEFARAAQEAQRVMRDLMLKRVEEEYK